MVMKITVMMLMVMTLPVHTTVVDSPLPYLTDSYIHDFDNCICQFHDKYQVRKYEKKKTQEGNLLPVQWSSRI